MARAPTARCGKLLIPMAAIVAWPWHHWASMAHGAKDFSSAYECVTDALLGLVEVVDMEPRAPAEPNRHAAGTLPPARGPAVVLHTSRDGLLAWRLGEIALDDLLRDR